MNFRNTSYTAFIILFLYPFHDSLAFPNNKELEYIDKIYEEQIKTAILFHADDIKATPLYPAVIHIAQQTPLMLKFDELFTDDADYYKAKIIHCNMAWSSSSLSELQYLYEYNEFSIDEFEFSIATKVPYTHFTFPVPRVKLTGNYLLVVYRDGDEKDIIISKRFIVYDQRVKINAEVGLSAGVIQRRLNQQIEFSVNYTNFPIPNPYLDIHVVLRQNHRSDNAIYGLKPTAVKEDMYQLDYRYFNFENNFKAGNEFRFFDIRSIHYGGRNVQKYDISETQIDAYLAFDKSRETDQYSFIRDLNGGYVIENSEGNNDFLESDYINVHFVLDLKGNINKEIFLGGKFADWRFGEFNKMNYMRASGLYTCNLLLKQGLYDYMYYIPEDKEHSTRLEGNHVETRNEYEIIMYYNDPRLQTDVIIGYMKLI